MSGVDWDSVVNTPAPAGGTSTSADKEAQWGTVVDGAQQGQQIRETMFSAGRVNPDEYGRAKQVERSIGLPAPIAARNLPDVEFKAQMDRYAQFIGTPLGRNLTNPDFASLAHDDTENLDAVQKTVAPTPKPVVTSAEFSDLVRKIKDQNSAFDWDNARFVASQQVTVDNSPGGISNPRAPAPTISNIAGGLWQSLLSGAETAKQGIRYQFADAVESAAPKVESALNAVGMQMPSVPGQARPETMSQDALAKYREAKDKEALATPDIESKTAKLLYGGAQNIVQNVPVLAASIATRNPTLGAALAAVQAEASAYPKYRERGGSGGEAALGASLEGAIEYATEKLPLSFLTESFGKTSLWKLFVGDQAREQVGEQIATHSQDLVDTVIANPNKTIGDYLRERPDAALSTAVAVLMQGVAIGGAHHAAAEMAGKEQQAQAATTAAAGLEQLGQLSEKSKVRGRDAPSFAQFVDDAAANGPVSDVYINANTLMQSAGERMPEVVRSSPSVAAQIDEALKTGGDVRIPLGEYASGIGATDLNNVLLQHLRAAPDAMTRAEAEDFMQQKGEEFQRETERILQEGEFDAHWQDSRAVVERELLTQLKDANRFTDAVNQPYAQLMASFYAVQAARLGITPEQMYVKYPLAIRAVSPLGGQALEQGARTETPEFKKWFGGSKVVDEKGAPQVVYHGTAGSIARFKTHQGAGGELGAGAYFSASPDYASNVADGVDNTAANPREGANVVPVYLALQNPLMVTAETSIPSRAALIKQGYDGIVSDDGQYVAFHPEQIKTATGDPNTVGQGERGRLSFADDITAQPSTIALLQAADLSTFLHEMGHFQLEVLSHMAAQPDAPQAIVDDMNAVLKWFGVPDNATWRAMSLEEKRPFHERFAEGFEAYLFEGKAPAPQLQGIFARFRAWMINVYRHLQALNVQLTDEVRGVFDRLVATNEQIQDAEAQRAYTPLFQSAEQADMTPEQWAAYQTLGTDATQEAVDQLQTRSLRDMQWLDNARGKALRRLQREAKTKRKDVQAEVTDQVRQEPVYAAQRFLRTGEMVAPDGDQVKVEKGFRLNTGALAEMYPETMLARPDIAGLRGMTSKDGLHPDQVAEIFGFTSGDHLVRSILEAQPEADQIEGRTDQAMLERYGDLSSPDALDRAANEAVHNDARARFVATEMAALDKAAGRPRVLVKAAKEFAATIIARKKIGDIRPAQYAAGETRAAKAAETALRKNDIETAAVEKRNQLVQGFAAKAALNALDEVEKGVRYLRRVADSETIDPDYREQIQAMLARFDLRQTSARDAQRRQNLAAWVEQQREQGLEPVIDERLLDEAQRTPYRELPLEEFRGVVDAVKNIEHLGRLKQKLLTAQDERDFAARVDEAATSIEENAKRTLPDKLERNRWVDKMKSGTAQFFAMHRKLASMLREMDGYNDNGALWNLITRPMNAAGDREAVLRETATIELSKLFEPLLKAGKLREKLYIPEISNSLSREGRIMVALNVGNEGNLQRLMDGDRWSPAQVRAILATLSRQELEFVQSVWDHIGSYKSEIGAQQKRLTGVEPEWVEATPLDVQIKGADGMGETVSLRGGYFPAKYDTDRSTRSLSDEAAANIMDQWKASRGRPAARAGFTKARADAVVNRPLRKDFGVITQHMTEVTHRLAWQEFLTDATRLLRAAPIDGAIRQHYGPEVLEAMRKTVEDIAAGEVGAQNAFESGINYLRSGATIAGLGWRLTTSLMQPLGLTQSMVRIGPQWVARGLVDWLGDAAKMENTVARISEKSDMMRLRAKTMQREISEIRNKVAGKDSAIEASYFYLIQKLQLVADVPTWLGQYHKSVDGGADEASAVAQADQAVIDAQGAGQTKDLAGIQRGGPLLKLFTNFYSFFNTTYNLTSEAVGRTDFKNPLSVGRLAVDMMLLYSVPAALGTLVKAALKGDDDPEKLTKQLIADQITYMLGTIVGLREIGGAAQTALGLPGDYSGPASVRFFSELAKLGKQVNQGEIDAAFWKSLNNVGGILFHYPAGQINATAEGMIALAEGRTQNPGALLVGPPAKH